MSHQPRIVDSNGVSIGGFFKRSTMLGPGDYTFTLRQGLRRRTYIAHVPPSYKKGASTPLIIALHGGGQDAKAAVDFFGLNVTADKDHFIVVYPQGTGTRLLGKTIGTWNADVCCGYAQQKRIDDVAFLSSMIDQLEKDFSIDPKRIFATGHSNGSMMAFKLACDLANRIAAIAPSSGQRSIPESCRPSRPVSILYFHGTEDSCALYDGGPACGGCYEKVLSAYFNVSISPKTWTCAPVPAYIDAWAAIDGCASATDISYHKGSATCVTHRSCRDAAEVTLCSIKGMGHSWPGGGFGSNLCGDPTSKACTAWKSVMKGTTSKDISANDTMWDFFEKHPMR